MTTNSTTDVLIVGAGPAGTTLAIDLARRGVPVRLIDKAPHAFDGSRAKGIQPRTLEILDDLGALPDVINHGALYPPMGIHLGPFTIPFRMMAKGKRGPDVPYPDTWLIPQHRTDRALHTRFESLGGRVDFSTELTEFTDHGTHVTAHVSTADGGEDITARYLVGADGGASRVRKILGVEFGGSTDEADRILIVDAAVSGGLSRKYWHVWPGLKGRFVGACPLPHSDKFQWMIRLSPDEAAPQDLAQINARIQAHIHNKRLKLHDIDWQSVFRPNIRLAANYRRGRVLLAGDAAHVHTPAGAQGLNTGIGDAYNLGWKLGQILAGADDRLLDTYEHERQPIAAGVLGLSTKKYEGIGKLDPSSIRRGKDEKQLALTYHGGPLASLAADRTKTLRVGDRAPNADLVTADGRRVRVFDAYRGPHFGALAYGAHAAAVLAELDWPATGAQLTRVIVDTGSKDDLPNGVLTDPTGQFAKIYGLTRDTLLFIRPDGYIGHIAIHNIAESTRTAVQSMTPHIVTSAPPKRS
ncbi:FAD-dependent monooxygenase [Mycolicibacterium wolinskyi]|uniref:FAD-binding monooxygenase n=1 Tax=Mycolicibacterium wolinskyi TaxID=59750 RepID=A0A1X2EVH0_9MYCO|nr:MULTISPECIES: FAD-dependent monooxygenase [Mycolicibacterium]MCV7285800.1 FAD-dependent monooxygenase [Mycolicibacterium wolinskyi]MCV7297134.1 FAD-dependent monooxygenase [Mycolicibacterium goodii]ORX10038.1 FAD-binding monooxygenase [Mycolicibacterium wolinskyi]